MTTETETFSEPWLTEVKKSVANAVSISWDNCHKIYVCTDDESHDQQVVRGYEWVLRVDSEGNLPDGTPAVDRLFEWFKNSCGLEFIQEIGGGGTSNSDFSDVIGQGAYHEDEEGVYDG
tara:strand:- start:306 stop:662 length:357 start_codon:yes stop_codon:yes gene_type:complete